MSSPAAQLLAMRVGGSIVTGSIVTGSIVTGSIIDVGIVEDPDAEFGALTSSISALAGPTPCGC